MTETSIVECTVCGDEMHYMDTMTISGRRMCLSCLRVTTEGQEAKISSLRAELEQARAELADKIDTNDILVRSVIARAKERDRSRRTIAALVVAARAMNSTARARLGWRRALTWSAVCRLFVAGQK